jgi:hypothetical protein
MKISDPLYFPCTYQVGFAGGAVCLGQGVQGGSFAVVLAVDIADFGQNFKGCDEGWHYFGWTSSSVTYEFIYISKKY